MKILFIATIYPREGALHYGCFNHELACALRAQGHDVRVCVPMPRIHSHALTLDGVPVCYCGYCGLGWLTRGLNGRLIARALLRDWPWGGWRPDVIDAHEPLNGGEAARLVAQTWQRPYVIHVHALDVYGQALRLRLKRHCRVYHDAAALICVSEATRANLDCYDQHFSPKAVVVHNGYNPTIFYPPVSREPSQVLRIISAGNLVVLKGHQDTLRALAALRDRGVDAQLDIYGSGPQGATLRALAGSLRIDHVVQWHGSVSVRELADAMRAADLFVLPSTSEAFGCVYLEAAACGLPFICCEGCGIVDCFPTAVTVPKSAPHALANRIVSCDRYPHWHVAPYTWASAATALATHYRRLVEDR